MLYRAVAGAALITSFVFGLPVPLARAQELHVRPYLQDATPSSAWILWETTSGEESRVEWGELETLGRTASGAAITTEGTARVHEVQLTGLAPATRYYYRAHTGAVASEVLHFTTPPARDAEASFRMIAVSDMQRDAANPDVYRRIIHDGILDFLAPEAPLVDDALGFVIIPGDLVDDGDAYESWRSELFDPAADLMSFVPFYPVLGNHERNAHYYYDYFHLPVHAGATEPDRWWRMDYGNVRVIGLDSNLYVLLGEQQRFLDESLESACTDDAIDFVFVQLHHAHQSELWPAGEQPLASQVVERMNRFGQECGRPTAQFYGHTHGYSRGASRDAAHLWINVASAGGNIDYWGEYRNQYDADEVSVSQDEWGFVVLDVTAGEDPSFRLRRVSLGNETTPRDNEVRDEVVIRRYDEPPATPMPRMPRGRVRSECGTLAASDFVDPDGDLHGGTHWQLAASCDDFSMPLLERYRFHENWYDGVDRQAGDDLRDEPLELLGEGDYRCWRVRYRDRGLAWSAWSAPVAFRIDEGGVGTEAGCDDPTPLPPPPPIDAAIEPDGGPAESDAGPSPAVSSGCGCRAAPRSRGGALGLGALALASLCLLRTRRPGRRVALL